MADQAIPHTQPEGAASDFSGFFSFLIDAPTAATRLFRRFFWIVPVVLTTIVVIATGIYNVPLARQAVMNQPPIGNVPPEQFQRMALMQVRIGMYVTPVILVIASLISALILLGMSSIVSLRARFLELFNFVAGLSIFTILQFLVATVILHAKGEPTGLADLQPAMGLDIFLPPGSSKLLTGVLGYFNLFQIWQIVMAVLILAAAYRIPKGRAAVVVAPMYLLGLLIKVAGAVMSRTS